MLLFFCLFFCDGILRLLFLFFVVFCFVFFLISHARADGYLHTDEEVKVKQEIWEDINKEYLQQMAERDALEKELLESGKGTPKVCARLCVCVRGSGGQYSFEFYDYCWKRRAFGKCQRHS